MKTEYTTTTKIWSVRSLLVRLRQSLSDLQ